MTTMKPSPSKTPPRAAAVTTDSKKAATPDLSKKPSTTPTGRPMVAAQVGLATPPTISAETKAKLIGMKQVGALPSGTIGAVQAITAWLTSQTIDALWTITQDRNSWVGITGIGWVKLSDSSDSGIVALTLLAAQARELQTLVDYRQEADGLIHEVYVW